MPEFGIMRDAQSAKPQAFKTGNGWFAYNLAVNLAQDVAKETSTRRKATLAVKGGEILGNRSDGKVYTKCHQPPARPLDP